MAYEINSYSFFTYLLNILYLQNPADPINGFLYSEIVEPFKINESAIKNEDFCKNSSKKQKLSLICVFFAVIIKILL